MVEKQINLSEIHPGASCLSAHMTGDGLAIELRTSDTSRIQRQGQDTSVFMTPAELERLYVWHKELHQDGHPFAIRLQDVWYPVEGGKSTKDKSEAKRFASMKEALDVRASLNDTWQTDSVIERLPT